MIRQLSIYLAATALLGAPLLAQDTPRPQPPPGAPGEPPRADNPPRDPNPERPSQRPDGARPRPPRDFDPFGPGGGDEPRPPRPPGAPGEDRPDRPEGPRPERERPPIRTDRVPEGYARPSIPGGERFGGYERAERALQPTPYIGVVTSPVSPALAAQLGLHEGFGLVVEDVLPDSPAKAAGLQKYDVLKLVNDQQLIDPNHLSGLVRGLGKDTEVTVTFIRKGQEQKASLKIAEKMLPESRPGGDLQRRLGIYGLQFPPQGDDPRDRSRDPQGPAPEQMRRMQEHMQRYREEMHRYQDRLHEWQKSPGAELPELPPVPSLDAPPVGAPTGPADLLREARPGGAPQLRLPQTDGVSTFETGRTRMVLKDSDGEIELALRDGQRMLTAKSATGEVVFTGPVDTPGQRNAVPMPFRAKLDALEAQRRNIAEGRLSPPPGERNTVPFPPPPAPLPDEPGVQ